MVYNKLMHEPEGFAIDYYLVEELFQKLQYGTHLSIGIKILHYTGCRIQELNKMYRSNITKDNYLYWSIGKNQKGYRKEFLPDDFIKELNYYWETEKVPLKKILAISSETLRRYFTRFRKSLSTQWNKKRVVMKEGIITDEYYYQLKGFRKNFATNMFSYFYHKYNDANISVELVSKRMKHSNNGMTITHYFDSMHQINAQKYKYFMPFEIVKSIRQHRIYDYCNT